MKLFKSEVRYFQPGDILKIFSFYTPGFLIDNGNIK